MRKELFVLAFLFLIANVSAIIVEEVPISEVIVPSLNQPATIQLVIDNVTEGDYMIYTLTSVKIFPEEKVHLVNGRNVVEITIEQTTNLKVDGLYRFQYFIQKDSGEKHEDNMLVKVLKLEDILEISSDVNRPEENFVKFYVKNKENVTLENLKAEFSTEFFSIEENFSIEPMEKKEFEIEVEENQLKIIEAGGYILNAKIDTPSGEKEISGKIYLGEKEGIETQEDEVGFIIKTTTINKINIGNTKQIVQIRVKKNFFNRFFTSFNVEPTSIEGNGLGATYVWDKELVPGGILNVKIKTNYLAPVLIILFVALLVYGIRKFNQKKIVVEKSVSRVRTKNDDFALKVKIRIHAIKNIENVSIVDKIPGLVKVYEKFSTLKPDKIDTKNRRLQWNLGNLDEGEERVFSYIIYSKISVVGKFSLPETTAVFEKEGQIHETQSNKVYFYHEEKK